MTTKLIIFILVLVLWLLAELAIECLEGGDYDHWHDPKKK